MKQQIFGLSLGLVAVLCAGQMVYAQQRNTCADRAVVLKKLSGQYGETRRSMGLAANNGIIEMHASDNTGTWTITVTRPDGVTCLLAAGNSFEQIEEQLPAALGAPT
ncbi:hypothetical protein [Litoreibacter roseus]|uniref:Uncharacterized protein n=1 Tax=Litoreibacter roseus TaxID=2601869 RepID=A0A6N6JBA3_9RHOB|nr:hypothetical protein [Litoreibacter roseus]GFE63277.1 hypothetical protein KIN_03510 [Litoreibacter roseus]